MMAGLEGKRSHHALRYRAHRLTSQALADPTPEGLMSAADAHFRAAKAHRAAGLHDKAAGHEGHARLLAYAATNPKSLGERTPGRIESQRKATAAAAASFDVGRHPRGTGGQWAPSGAGTHSHEKKFRGY